MKKIINRVYILTMGIYIVGIPSSIGLYGIILEEFNVQIPIQMLGIWILIIPLICAMLRYYTCKRIKKIGIEERNFDLFIFKLLIPLEVFFSFAGIIIVLS